MAYGDGLNAQLQDSNSFIRQNLAERDPTLLAVLLAVWSKLTPVQRLALARYLAHDIEDPGDDPEMGAEQASPPEPKAGSTGRDPRVHLATLNIPFRQVTSANYGYTGTFSPEQGGVFLHWTASAAGSHQAPVVLTQRHYHSCAGRDGVAYLGGWNVRQGHGGTGRTGPQSLARDGKMTVAELKRWHNTAGPDNSSSGANTWFMSVCLDNNGVGEEPGSAQWRAFTGLAAAFLVGLGKHRGHLVDHEASTSRKIDLGRFTDRYWNDVQTQIEILTKGPAGVTTAVAIALTPSAKGYHILVSDGGVFQKGDAVHPSTGGSAFGKLGSAPVDIVAHPTRNDAYLVLEANGGIHAFGPMPFHGGIYEDLR